MTAQSGAEPVVVLNKMDLCRDVGERVAAARQVAPGAAVIACSAREGTGLEGLAELVAPHRTAALLGSSGAGKSTILNWLLGEDRLRTGEVRAADSRGRHTTTHRELALLPGGGILIDTPGLRELQLWTGEESVEQAFSELRAAAASCRFRDCSHAGEPGCAVRAAIEAGEMAPERLESYQKLVSEARRHEALSDRLAAREQKRKVKQIHRAIRQHYRLKE